MSATIDKNIESETMQRSLKAGLLLLFMSLFIWNCSSGITPAEVDKKLKAVNDKNGKFQQMAVKKIGALEKDVATLKKNQGKLSKQIPVIVKQIKVLKQAIDAGGSGVSPDIQAQLDSLIINLEAMEAELALVKEMGPVVNSKPEVKAPPVLIKGSDQERIYRQYGDPIERYLVDDKNQVWLYDNGVAVFDMNGRIVSIEFK
jgi:seryl-tRNA synthetase